MTLHASARANRGSLPRTSPASHPHDEFSAPVRTRNRADWVWGGEKKKKKENNNLQTAGEKNTEIFVPL